MFANTEGSWLWAAQLNDERNFAAVELQHEKALRNPDAGRPQLAGYDALRSEIRDLRNDLRAIHHLPAVPGPEGPMDRIKARKKEISNRRLDAALGYDEGVS